MKRISTLLPLLAVALAAGPSIGVSATDGARPKRTNQAPVAVINNYSQKPIPASVPTKRFYFNASGSYDPDGSIVGYYWYPEYHCRVDGASTSTYYMDIPEGESCGLTLTVTDNSGATTSVTNWYTW